LKVARSRGLDIGQAILANYCMAAGLAWVLLKPTMVAPAAGGVSWVILILLGVLLPSVFMAVANAVRDAGIVRTEAAQRLSLFISLATAFVFFGDVLTGRTVTAIIVGLAALFCLMKLVPQGRQKAAAKRTGGWLLAVWLGYGAADILFKEMALSGVAFPVTLFSAFILAGVLMAIYLLFKRVQWNGKSLAVGLLLGALNFGNVLFYINAHQSLPNNTALVFSSMNIGVIALGTLVGAGFFHEHLSRVNVAGLVLAVAAIILMTPW
jgi:drug/metabolite transporter (DMT)-like permease